MKKFIESLKGKTVEELNEIMFDCAEKGDLEKVKILLTSPDLEYHADISDTNDVTLINACLSGNSELIKYLLTSPELEKHSDINAQDDLALSILCRLGLLDMVKYFMESPELKKHSQIPFVNRLTNHPIFLSCKYKNPEVFDYLVSFSEGKDERYIDNIFKAGSDLAANCDLDTVKSFIQIIENKDSNMLVSFLEGIIYGACAKDNAEIVKYIFTSPQFKNYIDIHKNDDEIFREILMWTRLNKTDAIARYLILELNIEENDKIKSLKKSRPCELIEDLFKLRILNNELHQELPLYENNDKLTKPKL